MDAIRFAQFKADRSLIAGREEEEAFERALEQEVRNARAKRSAETRRKNKEKADANRQS